MRMTDNSAGSKRADLEWLKVIGAITLVFTAAIYLLIPRWISYLSASSEVNQLDTDFLYFDVIHNQPGNYSNVLIANVVDRVHASFGVLIRASRFLSELGIDQNLQLVIFFYAQVLMGIIGVYYIARGLKLVREEWVLVFAFFLFSYFAQFGRYIGGPGFYNKVTVSCLALSFGYLIIGLFVNGRYRLSIAASALLIYVHPVYSAVFLGLNSVYGGREWLIRKSWSTKYALSAVLMSGVILLPFAYGVVTSPDLITGQGIGDLWWTYLKAKTSNPFPMQDGFAIVVPTLVVLFIAHRLLGRIGTPEAAGAYSRAQWVIGGVIAAWLIQILFTEVFPVSLVARLSLTRTTPFGLLFIVIAYVGVVWRYRHRDDSGLWLFLLLTPALLGSAQLVPADTVKGLLAPFPSVLGVFGGYWPDFATYPDILLLFLILVTFAIRVGVLEGPAWLVERIEDPEKKGRRLYMIAAAVLALIVLFELSLLTKNWDNRAALGVLMCVVLFVWVLQRLSASVMVLSFASAWVRRHSTYFVFGLVFATVLPLALKSANALLLTGSSDTNVEQMWKYIERNTRKNEMILVVPLFDTRKYPVMPLRPVFVDWGDAQYVLYDFHMLNPVLERLSLIGMDVERALRAKRCDGIAQYADPMCRRKLFESLSQDYSDAWRENLPRIRQIAPNLTYVMMHSKYVTPADNVIYISGDISLIKL